MSRPRVSIGMPVFNGARFLRQSAESILRQDFNDLELVISDNASTDETESICRQLADRDSRVRYYRSDANRGAAWNYNRVFELSHGEYFKWAAHDDECHHAMLSRCVEALDSAPESVAMVYPLGELIDEYGKTLSSPLDHIDSSDARPYRRLARVLSSLNMCDPIFGLIKTSYLRKTQLIGPFFGADYVLLGELAMLGEIRELHEVLFRLRAHPKRSMKANRGARAQAAWYAPSGRKKLFVMPGWERMVWELMKSARRSPLLPFVERLCCTLAVPGTHYWRRFRNAGGRVKRRMRTLLPIPDKTRRSPDATERQL